jgi:hypothetical protein
MATVVTYFQLLFASWTEGILFQDIRYAGWDSNRVHPSTILLGLKSSQYYLGRTTLGYEAKAVGSSRAIFPKYVMYGDFLSKFWWSGSFSHVSNLRANDASDIGV